MPLLMDYSKYRLLGTTNWSFKEIQCRALQFVVRSASVDGKSTAVVFLSFVPLSPYLAQTCESDSRS